MGNNYFEIEYNELVLRILDYKVVATGYFFTWVKFEYEVIESDGEVVDKDWSSELFGTFGYDGDCYDDEDNETEMTDEEYVEYVDNLFHEAYELDNIIEGVTRWATKYGDWSEVKSDNDIHQQLCDYAYCLRRRKDAENW